MKPGSATSTITLGPPNAANRRGRALGAGVQWVVDDTNRFSLEVYDLRAFRDAVADDDVIVHLAQATTAVDHITSLTSFGMLTFQNVTKPNSISFSRDLHTALVMILGVMHELSDVLNRLGASTRRRFNETLPEMDRIRELKRQLVEQTPRQAPRQACVPSRRQGRAARRS